MTPTAQRLSLLTQNARRNQWSASDDLDWSLEPVPPRTMTSDDYVWLISQLYHGERATQAACGRVMIEIENTAARDFLATQMADEARHEQVYAAYLRRLGDFAEIDPALSRAYSSGQSWPGTYHGMVVAFHVLLEGEVVSLQQDFLRWFSCPMLDQINRRIARDEARHVAFGKIYLKPALADLSLEERIAIFQWVRGLWRDCAEAVAARYLKDRGLMRRFGAIWLDARWRRQLHALQDIGLVGSGERPVFVRA